MPKACGKVAAPPKTPGEVAVPPWRREAPLSSPPGPRAVPGWGSIVHGAGGNAASVDPSAAGGTERAPPPMSSRQAEMLAGWRASQGHGAEEVEKNTWWAEDSTQGG